MLLAYQYNGEISMRSATATAGGYPNGVFICQDGYVQVAGGRNYFDRVVVMMGAPDVLLEERWYTPEAQYDPEFEDEFNAYFIPWCLERTKREIWHVAQEVGVLSAPINAASDFAGDSEFQKRGAFAEIEHPIAGKSDISRQAVHNERIALALSGVRRHCSGSTPMKCCAVWGYAQGKIDLMREQGTI